MKIVVLGFIIIFKMLLVFHIIFYINGKNKHKLHNKKPFRKLVKLILKGELHQDTGNRHCTVDCYNSFEL